MHMGSYKSLSFVQVNNTGWFHTFTEFRNWALVEMMSEADDAFLHVHLDHVQPKSQDYAITSGSVIWLQTLNSARTPANGKDAEKMFVPRPLAKGQCIPGVGAKR